MQICKDHIMQSQFIKLYCISIYYIGQLEIEIKIII